MKRGEFLLVVGLVLFVLVSLVSVRITSALTTFPAGTTCADFHDTIRDDLFVHGINNEHYELEGDIDCSGYTFTPIGSVSGLNFGGILDGRNYIIRNLRINRPSENYIGLFRKMSGGEIKNLGLENVDIEGNQFVGGFSGYTGGIGTKITNSHATGTIKGSAWVGGFSGTEVDISWSYSNVNVEGGPWTGGLIGTGGAVENSYARGSVTGSSHCGGLIGVSGNIKYSYSTGSVSCDSYPGGLIGSFGSPTCLASFWDTQTSGQSESGCGVAKITALMKTESTFTNAGWDFTNIWDIDSTNDGYPYLRPYSETPSFCGDGTCNVGDETCGDTDTAPECNSDCSACPVVPTCSDGIQNQGETGVDCGGSCPACIIPSTECGDDDIIMKLFKPSNSHGALWNQSYDYDICCSKIFGAGNPACSLTSPHDCKTDGSNKVVELFQQNNSHTQIPNGPLAYNFDVCYGNLICTLRDNECRYDEEMVVALYQNNNSHITDPTYIPDGMISWWRMDKGAVGTDISYDFLNKNNLTFYNMEREDKITGKIGAALVFDGVNEHGKVDADSSLDLEKFTTEAWFKLNSLPAEGSAFNILAKGESITDGHSNYMIEVFQNSTGEWGSGAKLACRFENHSDKNYRLIYPIDNSYIGKFVHVACTLDGDNWKMYIDGEEVSTTIYLNYNLIASLSGAIPATSSAPFYIGAMFGTSVDGLGRDEVSNFFPGTIDDVAIYNRALTEEEIQHRYNMGMYEKKICCKSGVENVYWADRTGRPISKAQVGDTVLMIYQGTYSEHNFSIYEKDLVENDDIRTGNDAVPTFMLAEGKAIAKWKITDSDLIKATESSELDDKGVEFYFRVDGKQSADLNVSIIPNNSEPHAIINYPNLSLPLENRRFRLGRDISFNQTSWDEDDDLLITWHLDNETKINCTIEQNCNITHAYTMWGTKDVILEAEETSREIPKKADDRTQIFIYNESINVFALITEPPFNKTFNSSESTRGIHFNASKSWVANCTTSATLPCGPHGESCYNVDGLRCYDLNKTGTYGIGNSAGYDLRFDWAFDDGTSLFGNWTSQYSSVVDFEKYFYEPTKHELNLKVGYDPK